MEEALTLDQMDLDLTLKTSRDSGQTETEHLQGSMAAIPASKTHAHPDKIIMGRSLAQYGGTCLCLFPFSVV